MEKTKNPNPERGERNIFFPYYGECLDYAVNRSWKSWNCSECTQKMKEDSFTKFNYIMCDTDSCCDLPSAVTQRIRNTVFEKDHD